MTRREYIRRTLAAICGTSPARPDVYHAVARMADDAANVYEFPEDEKGLTKSNDMNNKKIYISGAIAHYDLEERKAAFGEAARHLSAQGYEPVNPFDNGLPQDSDWREHMRVDIGMLLECKYIYMLKGWWVSKGAKLELDVATSCGLKPLFEEDNQTSNTNG